MTGPVAKKNTNFLLAANQKMHLKCQDGIAENTLCVILIKVFAGLDLGAVVDFRLSPLG